MSATPAPASEIPEPGRRIAAVDVALRRVRVVGALLVVAGAVTQRHAGGLALLGGAAAVAAALLLANALSLWGERGSTGLERTLVVAQVGIDALASLAVVVVAGGVDGSLRWALLLLPVLHAALRYQLTGVLAAWGGLATALVCQALVSWDPREGPGQLAPLVQPLAVLLLVGLVVGYLAAQLVEEILAQRTLRTEAARRAELLAAVTIAARDLTSTDASEIAGTAVRTVLDLGFDAAELVDPDDAGAVLAVAGGPMRPVVRGRAPAPVVVEQAVRPTGLMLRAVGPVDGGLPRQQALDILVAATGNALDRARRFAQLEELRSHLAHEATHDQLTGVLNRAGLLQELGERLGELGPGHLLPVLFVDLDGFKSVNDDLGHEVGDRVLRDVADALAHLLPPGTLVARLGGDEFVVVLPALPGDGLARAQAEQRRLELSRSLTVRPGGGGHAVTASVGLHLAPAGQDADACLRCADDDMYQEKRRRRMGAGAPGTPARST